MTYGGYYGDILNEAEEDKQPVATRPPYATSEEEVGSAAMGQEALDRGEVISFVDPVTAQETVATKLVTPDFYQKYMAPNAGWQPGVGRMPRPSPDVQAAVMESVWNHWDTLEKENPGAANRLMNNPGLLFADAELAGALDFAGTWGPLDKATEWLIDDPNNVKGYESHEETWKSTTVTRAFLEKHGRDFMPGELDVISTSYAALPAEYRDNLSANADLWWKNKDKQNPDHRAEFLVWFFNQASSMSQDALRRQSQPVFEALDQPLRAVQAAVFNPMIKGLTWLSPGTPQDMAMMGALTQGQQLALAAGIDPGEFTVPEWMPAIGGLDAYSAMSGTWDGAAFMWQDPIGWLAAAGVASKTAKTVPAIGRLASMGKWQRAARTMIPFVGRSAQPGLPRGPIIRSFWSVFSKTQDEMLDTFGKKGGFEQIYNMLNSKGGLSSVVERYPELERVAGSVGYLLTKAKSADEVELIFRDAYKLGFVGEKAPGVVRISEQVSDLRRAHTAEAALAAERGDLAAQHVNDIDGIVVSHLVDMGVRPAPGLAATPASLSNSGRRVFGWKKGTRIRKLNRDDLLAWGRSRHLDDPFEDLTPDQIENLARNYEQVPAHKLKEADIIGQLMTDPDPERLVQLSGDAVGTVVRNGEEVPVYLHASQQGRTDEWAALTGGPESLRYDLRTADGETVAAVEWGRRTDEFGGKMRTWDGYEQQGIGTMLWEAIARVEGDTVALDGISRMGKNATEAGAKATHRATQVLMDRINRGSGVRVLEALESGRLSRDERFVDFLLDYMDAKRIDVLQVGEESILGRKAPGKMVSLVDNAELERPRELTQAALDIVRGEAIVKSMSAGDNSVWVITDVPHVRPSKPPYPWKKHGTTNAKGWWGNFKRTMSARAFSPEAPTHIDLDDAAAGARQLRQFLRQLGVKRETIQRWYNEFIVAPYEQRYNVASAAITSASDEIDHPILRYGLVEFFNRGGDHSFGYAFGEEVGRAASTSREGATSSLPWLPTHLATRMDLPGQDFFSMLSRYRSAKAQGKAFGGLGRMNVRGLTGSTRNARKGIATRYRNMLESRGIDIAQFDDDDLMAMAYATILPDQAAGVGKMRNFMATYPGGAWRGLHSVFTRAQLALRPIAWPFKVVVIEEQIRGALFDLPSMYRNPFRMMGRWRDSYLLGRYGVHKAKNVAWAQDLVQNTIGARMPVDEALAAAERIIPGFKDLAASKKATSTPAVRALLGREISRALDMDTIYTGGKSLRRKLRARRIQKAEKRLQELGLPKDFDWGDIDGIASKGIVQLFGEEAASSPHTMSYVVGGMTQRQVRQYGQALGGIWYRTLEDPVTGKFGLARVASRATGEPVAFEHSAQALVDTTAWRQVRNNVVRILEERGFSPRGNALAGIPPMTEVALAERYLDELVDPYMDDIFGVLWADEPQEAARIARELLEDRETVVSIGGNTHKLSHRAGNRGGFTAEVQKLAEDADVARRPGLPEKIAPMFDPRFMMDDDGNVLTASIKKLSNALIRFGGETITQNMNRRPAYLDVYDRWRDVYKGMGYPDDVAAAVAHEKAVEMVNYVYYNMDNATPFLRKFNRVMPFGAAAWEVAQTWFYKIPFAQTGAAGGPAIYRKVDRTLRALQNLGIVSYEGDPETGETTMYLHFSSDPETGKPIGDFISKLGYHAASAPKTVVEHFVNIRNALFDEDVELSSDPRKDHLVFQVGNPLLPFGENGIMAVNQFYFSVNPVAQYPLSKVLDNIPGVVNEVSVAGDGEKTLSALAVDGDVDPVELYRYNRETLREAMGADQYNQLLKGEISAEEVVIPEGVSLAVPGSSFFESYIIPAIYPFGKVDSVAGSLYSMVPSTFQYMYRGMGLWGLSGDDKFWTTDEDGKIKLDNGFLEAFSTPVTRAQIASEIIGQLQHLEASEGLLSKWEDAAAELERLTQEGVAAGLVFEGEEGNQSIRNRAVDPEAAEAWQQQFLRLKELNARIIKRATDNAGGALFFRGMIGSVAPATPRMLFDEQKRIEHYWLARELADEGGSLEGKMVGRLPRSVKDVESFNGLLTRFLGDSSGDDAKRFLKSNYPELWPFAFGKTYWGPGGTPPEVESLEEWSRQIQSGERTSVPFDVWIQRYTRAGISLSRETKIVDRFGADPDQAAIEILNNWEDFVAIGDEARVEFAALDYYDELTNGGDYLAWKNRNRTEAPVYHEELQKRWQTIADAAAELEDVAPSQDMTIEERRDFVNNLKQVARGFRDLIQEFNDEADQAGYNNPRERKLNWYFDNVMAPHYEKLAELYDAVDAAEDSEERARAYDEITAYETKTYQTRVFDTKGNEFPNPMVWTWSKRSEDDQAQRAGKWLVGKPEWLNLQGVHELVKDNPALQRYLPTTEAQLEDWHLYDRARNELADLAEPAGPLGEPGMTMAERRRAQAGLEAQLRQRLVAEGRDGELLWLDMYPLERLAVADRLPPSLLPWVEGVTWIRNRLAAEDKGATSTLGRQLFGQVYQQLGEAMQNDARLREDVFTLGEVYWDEFTYDSIFARLFMGDDFGEI